MSTTTAFKATVGTSYTLVADFTTNNNSSIEHKYLQIMCPAGVEVALAGASDAAAPSIYIPANVVSITQRREYGIHGKLYAKVGTGTQDIYVNVW